MHKYAGIAAGQHGRHDEDEAYLCNTHTCIYIYKHKYIHIHTYIHMYIYAYMHMYAGIAAGQQGRQDEAEMYLRNAVRIDSANVRQNCNTLQHTATHCNTL